MEPIPAAPAPDELYAHGLHEALRESRLFASILDDRVVHAIEAEVEPVSLRSGEVVVHEGDPSDSLYIVVSGRLRVSRRGADGTQTPRAEVGRGDSVGEMGLITGEPRSATVYAIRDSLLGRLSRTGFERLLRRHPQAMMDGFAGSIIRTLRQEIYEPGRTPGFRGSIALVPAEPDLPLDDLAAGLVPRFAAFGPTLHLSSGRFDAALQRPGAAKTPSGGEADPGLVFWLGEQELRHRYLLFQADPLPSAWSERCIRQADRVVVVARAAGDPRPGPTEQALLGGSPRQPVSLVLLHDPAAWPPRGTQAWLEGRALNAHHHVREGNDADLDRLARLLTDNGVGMVFAGGGARAVVGLGVLRALVEAGVPIDAVGGTSAGALLAGMVAVGMDYHAALAAFRRVKNRVDYTLPIHSLSRGRSWSSALSTFFGDTCVEDLPIGFFSTSVNVSDPRLVVHRRGSLVHAVRASSALPGVLPPVWDDGDILVDGALVNNLPVDVMRSHPGIGHVAAVEIGSGGRRRKVKPFGYEVSGWSALWRRATRPGERSDVPAMIELLFRSMLVGDALSAHARRNVADRIFRPPTRGFSLLDWTRAEEVAEAGYHYARKALDAEPPVELRPGSIRSGPGQSGPSSSA